jgi:hypothetical protein
MNAILLALALYGAEPAMQSWGTTQYLEAEKPAQKQVAPAPKKQGYAGLFSYSDAVRLARDRVAIVIHNGATEKRTAQRILYDQRVGFPGPMAAADSRISPCLWNYWGRPRTPCLVVMRKWGGQGLVRVGGPLQLSDSTDVKAWVSSLK